MSVEEAETVSEPEPADEGFPAWLAKDGEALPEALQAFYARGLPVGVQIRCERGRKMLRDGYVHGLRVVHKALAQAVRRAWRLEGTPFTSGIVNRDNPLAYHFDSGNFRGVWSAMLGFRRDVSGGALAVPAYDVGFAIADRSLLLFDGQSLLHGVTPFRRTSPHGCRITVVYYSLDEMWRCLPPGEEAKRPRRG